MAGFLIIAFLEYPQCNRVMQGYKGAASYMNKVKKKEVPVLANSLGKNETPINKLAKPHKPTCFMKGL